MPVLALWDNAVYSLSGSRSRIFYKCLGLNQRSAKCFPNSKPRNALPTTSNRLGTRWSGSAASSRPWMWRASKDCNPRRSPSKRPWFPPLLLLNGRQWCLLGKWSGPWNRVRLPLALSPIPRGSRHERPLMHLSWDWSGFRWVAVPASMTCSTPVRGPSRWQPLQLRWWHGRLRQLQLSRSRRTQCHWLHPSLACRGWTGGRTGSRPSKHSSPWRDSRTWTTWSQLWARISRGWSRDQARATGVWDGWKRPWSDMGFLKSWFSHCPGIRSGSSFQTAHINWESPGPSASTWEIGKQNPPPTFTPGRKGMWSWTSGEKSSHGSGTSTWTQERRSGRICLMKIGMTSMDPLTMEARWNRGHST